MLTVHDDVDKSMAASRWMSGQDPGKPLPKAGLGDYITQNTRSEFGRLFSRPELTLTPFSRIHLLSSMDVHCEITIDLPWGMHDT